MILTFGMAGAVGLNRIPNMALKNKAAANIVIHHWPMNPAKITTAIIKYS